MHSLKMTLGEAAKHTGLSKATLSRALAKGQLSHAKLDDGSFAIDPSELDRWYSSTGHRNRGEKRIDAVSETPETHNGNNWLQVELETLRQRLQSAEAERDRERSQLSSVIEDLRKRLDEDGEERRRLTMILTDQTARAAPPVPVERPRSFFGWLGRRSA